LFIPFVRPLIPIQTFSAVRLSNLSTWLKQAQAVKAEAGLIFSSSSS
jgi:hypothetical protein